MRIQNRRRVAGPKKFAVIVVGLVGQRSKSSSEDQPCTGHESGRNTDSRHRGIGSSTGGRRTPTGKTSESDSEGQCNLEDLTFLLWLIPVRNGPRHGASDYAEVAEDKQEATDTPSRHPGSVARRLVASRRPIQCPTYPSLGAGAEAGCSRQCPVAAQNARAAVAVGHDVAVDSHSLPDPVIRYRPRGRWQWMALWFLACFSCVLMYIAILIVDAPKPLYGGAIFATIVAVLVWLGFLLLAFAAFRPIRITHDDLFIPGLFSTVRIPVDEIAGVGLLFRNASVGTTRFSGWYPYVWRRDGTVVRLTRFDYTPNRWIRPGDTDGKGRRIVTKGNVDEMRSTNPTVMAKSAAGQLVSRHLLSGLRGSRPIGLARFVSDAEAARLPRETDGSVTAIWSPDGEMERLR